MPERVGVWEREKDIGSGGFGMVVLWRKVPTGERIAIKQCRWGEAGTGTEALMVPKVRERWQKEVEIMLKLNHRGIVSCMPLPEDFQVEPGGLPRLCMEYCVGGDLRRVLLSAENCCGLPELSVRHFLSDITDAVGYLHGLRIIHRDLKPENVVLQQADGRLMYKLIDLGYAKELDQSSVCTSFVGTLQYLAPELFLTNKYTCTADYWSLGLVAHEVVTGVRPFLPNMLPAMWMQQVSQKGPDDICAEEMEDGSIEFRPEITFCNQISSPLRRHLELWLRRLLDWEPRRRGRSLPPADGPPQQQQPVMVFSQLQALLQRRVVAVFVVPRCQLLHLEITQSTSMAELQAFIAAETGLEPTRQDLRLPPSCGGRPVRTVDTTPTQPALQCWAPPEETDWVLYVFDRAEPAEDGSLDAIVIPPLVRGMLRSPEHRPAYYRQRAVFAQSVFMIQQHMRLLALRQKAQHVHMMSLAAAMARLTRLSERLGSGLARLQAASELFLASLGWDDDKYSRQAAAGGVTSDRVYRTWQQAGDQVRRRLQQNEERAQQLARAVSDVTRRGTELQRVPASGQAPDGFSLFYEKACEAYDTHRRRPKEQRNKRTNNAEMIRIVARFFRGRNEPFQRVHQMIAQQQVVQQQVDQLYRPLLEAVENLQRCMDLISRYQKQRQAEIWKFMELVLMASASQAAAAAAAVADGAPGPAGPDTVGSGPPAPARSVQACLADLDDHLIQNGSAATDNTEMVSLANLLDSATLETSDAVSENLNLHAEISELLQSTEPAPPPDGGQIDWSFLN